jgi:chitinase
MSNDQIDPTTLPDAPQPQLSRVRVMLAVLVIVALGAGAFFTLRDVAETRIAEADAASRSATWFAPYVDATLTPTVAFQDRASNPARDVVLGFIVAGKTADTTCTPTWGTYETLDSAASTMDLDRRVAQTRGQGGDAIISFGGQANTELAMACDDAGRLQSAYASVVQRYSADTIDFDIEGEALHDTAANARRATAVKALQDRKRAGGGRLAVWLTLPVTPDGLDPDALAVVRSMTEAKVDLAGVNVMAMDFGVPSARKDMLGAVESSLTSTHAQLGALFGTDKSPSQLWGKLGATVMIGQNDVDGESLTVADARKVSAFASSRGIARVSTWSLNRDTQCGATFPVIGTHSNLCSGVAQKPLEFTKTFAKLKGTARAKSAIVTAPTALPAVTSETKDDPARSPYPIWQPLQPYPAGYKVVWHQAVYVAKWYTQGDSPDAQNVAPGNAPWRLVGPVLSTDRAPVIPKLAAGTHPTWSAHTVFRSGDKILYQGLPYQASWYTQGDIPGGTGPNGTPSPWKALYRIPGEPTDG